MNLKPVSGPHTGASRHVSAIMMQVMLALLPATLVGLYLFGWPAINLFVITVASAAFFELFCLRLSGRKANTLLDGSALLTGWLVAMTLPPWAPWWIGVVGAAIAIILGKQVFGGLGQNVFNPAMLARVALLISFPVELTTWPNIYPLFSEHAPGFIEGLSISFGGIPNIDATTSASVLGHVKTELTQSHFLPAPLTGFYSTSDAWLGSMRGSLGETSSLLIAMGGVALLILRVISWHIPVSMLLTVTVLASIFNSINPEIYLSPWVHLTSGALMLGAFFIATDYVTSPNSALGQIIFGVSCGVLVYIIRTWGNYPEGVGFAVLLMNAATPLIDHYIKPRIYGRNRKGMPLELKE